MDDRGIWPVRRMAAACRRHVLLIISGCVLAGLPSAGAVAATPVSDEVRILELEDRREAVAALVPFLESPRAETRARACLALGRIAGPAEDGRAVAAPTAWLATRLRDDSSPRVRRDAAFALGLFATPNAGAVLARVLATGVEPDPEVREAAVEGLGRCGPGPHTLAMERALRDPDPRVIRAALLAVWRGPASAHLGRILDLSTDRDPEIRWRAAYALMRLIGTPPAGRTPATTSARLGNDERDQVLWRMQTLAADPEPRVALQALRALGTRTDGPILSSSGGAVIVEALAHPDPRVRVEALRSLGTVLEGAGACEGLEDLLRDPHPHVRVALIQAAGSILDVPALMAVLDSTFISASAWERATAYETAIASLRRARDTEEALHLIERGRADPDWTVRYATASGLAEWFAGLGPDSSRTLLADSLVAAMERVMRDEPRVAKAVVTDWVFARAAHLNDMAALWGEVQPRLTQDDPILRALWLDGLSRYVERLGEKASPDSAEAVAEGNPILDPLLELVAPLAHDPSADVRTSLVALLGQCMSVDPGSERAALGLFELATRDIDHGLRQTAIRTLREKIPEGSPWRSRVATLEPGPQETDWSPGDYLQALTVARNAREARIETGAGTVRVRLLGSIAPLTVYNFVRLTRRGFFDGGAWHRVVPDFVVQDGCPRHDGWGGPGYAIRCEINGHHYETGTLGMALSGKDTGGSQFFFTLSDQPHLDGRYTIFGRVLEGQVILSRIAQGEPIRSVEILFDGPTPDDLQ